MTVRGKVKSGKVLLDDPKAIPDGAEVEVRVVTGRRTATAKKPGQLAYVPISRGNQRSRLKALRNNPSLDRLRSA